MIKHLLALALLTGTASAQYTYIDQPPDHGQYLGLHYSDTTPNWFTGDFSVLAEYIHVPPGERIRPMRLTWWGGMAEATFQGGDRFTIELRQDDGAGGPGGPGDVLYSYSGPQPTATPTGFQYGTGPTPWIEHRYEVDLDDAPSLAGGSYYLVIYNDTVATSDGTWAWISSVTHDPHSDFGYYHSFNLDGTWFQNITLWGGQAFQLEVEDAPTLKADVTGLSLSAGGTQSLTVDVGPQHAGELYLLLGSASGTSPGLDLGSVHVPLVHDPYLDFTLANPNSALLPGSFGSLDAQGRAWAGVTFGPGQDPALVGMVVTHAGLVLDPVTLAPSLASGPVHLTLAP